MLRMGAGAVLMLFGTIEERVCCGEERVQYQEVGFLSESLYLKQ